MRVWLRLTLLFGLPDDQPPENLMAAALGPILRAAGQDLAEAPLPAKLQKLLDQLARDKPQTTPRPHRNINRPELILDPLPNSAPRAPGPVQYP